uniref:Uncharacterized protein n=1 Tax=Arundo donax TaxID=35708 RepID=A0A0A9AXZ4_ARUDO
MLQIHINHILQRVYISITRHPYLPAPQKQK